MRWKVGVIKEIEKAISKRYELVHIQIRYNKGRIKVFADSLPPKERVDFEEETIIE